MSEFLTSLAVCVALIAFGAWYLTRMVLENKRELQKFKRLHMELDETVHLQINQKKDR